MSIRSMLNWKVRIIQAGKISVGQPNHAICQESAIAISIVLWEIVQPFNIIRAHHSLSLSLVLETIAFWTSTFQDLLGRPVLKTSIPKLIFYTLCVRTLEVPM